MNLNERFRARNIDGEAAGILTGAQRGLIKAAIFPPISWGSRGGRISAISGLISPPGGGGAHAAQIKLLKFISCEEEKN